MDHGGNRNTGAFAFGSNGAVASLAGGNGTLLAGNVRTQDTEFAVVRAGINYKFGSY
jgi:outer membrane immunogenic protein